MALTTVTIPGPTGTPVPLAAFGIPVANNINELIADITPMLPILSPWTAYTPTWTQATTPPTLGDAVIAGRYLQVAKTGWLNFYFRFGAGSSVGTGEFRFSLPPSWTVATLSPVVNLTSIANIYDASLGSGGQPQASWAFFGSGLTYFTLKTHLTSGNAQQGVPMTWDVNDIVEVTAVVELA